MKKAPCKRYCNKCSLILNSDEAEICSICLKFETKIQANKAGGEGEDPKVAALHSKISDLEKNLPGKTAGRYLSGKLDAIYGIKARRTGK